MSAAADRSPRAVPRLMLVTDRHRCRGRPLVPLIVQAIEGGVDWVQVREKDLADDALRAIVLELRGAAPGVRISVNSSRRVARTLDLGLHLPASAEYQDGQTTSGLWGRSVHGPAEAESAAREGADYVVAGTVYPTESKPGRRGRGSELVEEIVRVVSPVPVLAIGGVSVTRIPELIHAGAHGVAVCGVLLGSNHPRRTAQSLRLALDVALRASR
ncbi:MAG: thiamine phosphate synthase [bacterium]|nr:thiamine phosphate synthase [bacterium]